MPHVRELVSYCLCLCVSVLYIPQLLKGSTLSKPPCLRILRHLTVCVCVRCVCACVFVRMCLVCLCVFVLKDKLGSLSAGTGWWGYAYCS